MPGGSTRDAWRTDRDWLRSRSGPELFRDGEFLDAWITNNAHVQEADGKWVEVDLWPSQLDVVDLMDRSNNLIVLKARQLGLTWLCVFEIVWMMILKPGLQVGVYSLREEEAAAVIQRIKDVFDRVQPHWRRRGGGSPEKDNNTHWRMGNGSAVRGFSSRSGDSYTLGYVLVDEADLIDNLDQVLRKAEPTLSGGGYIRLVSRSDKTRPDSLFKKMYRAAIAGEGKWSAAFLPWWARPGRTEAWYQQERKTSLATRGNLDFVYEQYPASPSEALAPSESDKRFPMAWVEQCSKLSPSLAADDVAASVAGLMVWELPDNNERYFIGADPAEGNPTSDDSAAQVVNASGRQVARIRGRHQPAQLAHAVSILSAWYSTGHRGEFRHAPVLVERNNHGHAVILALQNLYPEVPVAIGRDGHPGWLSNAKGNAALYDDLADSLRGKEVLIRDEETAIQLQLIQGADLSAPEGMMDDAADAFALADQCRKSEPVWKEPTSAPNPHVDRTPPGPHGTTPSQGPPHWQQPAASAFQANSNGPPHWRT